MKLTSVKNRRLGSSPTRVIAIVAKAIMGLLVSAQARTAVADTPPADFFPIGVYWQPVQTFADWKSRGVNTVINFAYDNASMEILNKAAVDNQMWMIRNARSNIKADVGQKYLLAYEHTDEPDIHNLSAADLAAEYTKWKTGNPSIPVIVNVSGANVIYDQFAPKNYYKNFFDTADIVNSDTYPLAGWGRPNWIDKNFVMKPNTDPANYGTVPFATGQAVDKIRQITGGKKQYAYIETSNINPSQTGVRGPTAPEFRGEVWDAVLHGAKGILYFPFTFPSDNDGTPPEIVTEMTKTDALITKMAAIINASDDSSPNYMSLSGGLEGMWRQYQGKLYYFVLNFSHTAAANAKVSLTGSSAFSGVDVLDESRKISLNGGVLTDSFTPYQLHIYEVSSGFASPLVGAAVPEPTGACALLLIAMAGFGRRRRVANNSAI